MKYIPPFDFLKGSVETASIRGELCVSITQDEFIRLIRVILSEIEIEEDWYLSQYQDVYQGILAGVVQSAKQHFIESGYFEGRLPFRILVDEEWYQREYPDVAESVRQKTVPSGQVHFETNGYREGRLPFDEADDDAGGGVHQRPLRDDVGLAALIRWQRRGRREPMGVR